MSTRDTILAAALKVLENDGASQFSTDVSPSTLAISSARSSALLMRRTTCGTELAG